MFKSIEPTSPFILFPKQSIHEVQQCVLDNYGQIKYELPFLNALCVEIPHKKIQTIKTNKRIAIMTEDIAVSKLHQKPASLISTRSKGRFPPGNYGEGISIAIIDTGISPHYDLIKPYNRILCFKDFVNGKSVPYDDDGHGTHVCGIAAGNGYSSVDQKYAGAAPRAALVALKALNHEGNGNASDILAAMQWIYDNHRKYNIRVVNLSLGITVSEDDPIDPLSLGANALVCAGLCVVAAAGNSGPEKNTITSPGISPLVITVGACDEKGRVPEFSSRGPTVDGIMKPDVLAPGVDIYSLSSTNSKGYISQTGTSMSAPFVAGLAADFYSSYPNARPLDVKRALTYFAELSKKADRNAQGYGLLSKDILKI